MSREILFRGRRLSDGEWVEGGIYCGNLTWIIVTDESGRFKQYMVDPSTVGQYTGLTDKNGKRIFEGDIVTFETTAYSFKPCVIAWSFTKMRFVAKGNEASYAMDFDFKYEVIGNIHDNPELLKEG